MTNTNLDRWTTTVMRRINAGDTIRVYGSSKTLIDALISKGAVVRGNGKDCLLAWTWIGPCR